MFNFSKKEEPKICRDCLYFIPYEKGNADAAFEFALCCHPKVTTINLVSGEKRFAYCSIERNSSGNCNCGLKGRNFELKQI
jgi:hypothetical protein